MHSPRTAAAKRTRSKALILLAACLLPLPAVAGWTTNVWPACEHPFDLQTQLTDCYNAIQERRWAIQHSTTPLGLDGNYYWTNNYTRFRDNADILRSSVRGLFDGYALNTNVAVAGTFDAWFATNSAPPVLSLQTACIQLKIPTNFCVVYQGPWRVELSGLGGLTNDIAAIGHGHGYTNSHTVLGGTNYPAGRSTWYTTDYGVDNLKALIQAVQWSAYDPDDLTYLSSADYRNSAPTHDDTWAEAMEWASSNEVATGDTFIGIGTRGEYISGTHQYFAYWGAYTWQYVCWDLGTNVPKTLDIYQYAEKLGLCVGTNDVFDAMGYPVRENVYTAFYSTNLPASAYGVTSAVQGQLTIPAPPWVDEPTVDPKARGWSTVPYADYCFGAVKWTWNYP